MKKLGFLLLSALILSISCKKATEETIDCVVELLFASIYYTADPVDPKEVTLTVDYGGQFNISVLWEYGDGTSETKSGTTTIHHYTNAGSYNVKANITLSQEKYSSCSTSKEKTVDVH
jgi:hypothetical protein